VEAVVGEDCYGSRNTFEEKFLSGYSCIFQGSKKTLPAKDIPFACCNRDSQR
jgi:hypothetical protein